MSIEKIRLFKRFWARHTAWCGPLLLYQDGSFRGGVDAPDGRWELHGDLLTLDWYHWPTIVLKSNGAGTFFSMNDAGHLTLHEDLAIEADSHLGGNVHGGDPETFYPDLWKWIVESFSVRSVLDVGCGEGHALAEFARLGVQGVGLDGHTANVIETTHKGLRCIQHDFTKGIPQLDTEFDLAWSCEFVEHVEEEFVENILGTFEQCRMLAMTHALPGQGGHHHVNCQPPEYWIDRLSPAGFTVLSRETAYSRSLYAGSYWGNTGLICRRSLARDSM